MAKDVLVSKWFFLGVKQTSTHTHLGFFLIKIYEEYPFPFCLGVPLLLASPSEAAAYSL